MTSSNTLAINVVCGTRSYLKLLSKYIFIRYFLGKKTTAIPLLIIIH